MSKNLDLKKISNIYINRGPGSFYYCFSFRDFNGEKLIKYEFIPDLCKKFKVEKNLINPIYSG